ncbi:DUF4349 domain-containing protein [Nocardioides limicola]|uniref:DUF4349 domain-containing protein n=1 Tax=Nocardioides limicola TaxID=2803368 RepID=UPI00193B1979|nr:DUF4349 domain-containing protein [Nocardioides sp. DJM-14]
MIAIGILIAVVLTGCGFGRAGDSADVAPSAPNGVAGDGGREMPGFDMDDPAEAPGVEQPSADDGSGEAGADRATMTPAVISTGTVSLRADDVGEARFEVQKVLDELGGTITDEDTETDNEGEVRRSRLVVRVPSDSFSTAMTQLAQTAELVRSTRSSEDVTTQVLDTEARVRAQRASLERIEALLAEARDLGDLVAIEAQLTRRQATLDSLLAQQAWLADQTTLSTITVHLQRSSEAGSDDGAGFWHGLVTGWHALVAFTTGLLTVLGVVTPFVAVALVLVLPLVLWWRRRHKG